jgi:hypothetical protein
VDAVTQRPQDRSFVVQRPQILTTKSSHRLAVDRIELVVEGITPLTVREVVSQFDDRTQICLDGNYENVAARARRYWKRKREVRWRSNAKLTTASSINRGKPAVYLTSGTHDLQSIGIPNGFLVDDLE